MHRAAQPKRRVSRQYIKYIFAEHSIRSRVAEAIRNKLVCIREYRAAQLDIVCVARNYLHEPRLHQL